MERGRDIPVGRADLVQGEAEELGSWGAGQTTVRNLMEAEPVGPDAGADFLEVHRWMSLVGDGRKTG